MAKKKEDLKKKVAIDFRFAKILAIISIIGFLEILMSSFFNFSFSEYAEFLWLSLIGAGFIIESKPKKIHKERTDDSVSNITSLVIGIIAIIAGILSIPQVGVDHNVFSATKGVISLIAIIFIAIESFIIKK